MKLKKLIALSTVALASTAFLAACAPSGSSSSSSDAGAENVLKVGIMAKTDATEPLWNKVTELAKAEGVTVELVEFTDYSPVNKALANGETDVNAFQHYNYLNNFNTESGEELVVAADTLLSPIRVFSGLADGKAKYTDINQIPDGAVISVPNDATNESRALYLLEAAGLIKLDVSGDELATIVNIVENPKNLDIKELDAAQTASTLTSVDAAVINNNYAVEAKVDYKTTLFKEAVDENSKQWVNVIAAQKDWEKSEKADAIKKLVKVYQTEEIAKIIYDASNGTDIPAWEGAPTFE